MSMKLSEVRAKVKVVTVNWADETVDVGFHPAAVTPELVDKVQQQAATIEGGGAGATIGGMLEPMLDWWDVLDDDGQRIPTDAETIAALPIAFLMAVLETVQEDMRPPERKG